MSLNPPAMIGRDQFDFEETTYFLQIHFEETTFLCILLHLRDGSMVFNRTKNNADFYEFPVKGAKHHLYLLKPRRKFYIKLFSDLWYTVCRDGIAYTFIEIL